MVMAAVHQRHFPFDSLDSALSCWCVIEERRGNQLRLVELKMGRWFSAALGLIYGTFWLECFVRWPFGCVVRRVITHSVSGRAGVRRGSLLGVEHNLKSIIIDAKIHKHFG